MTRRFIDYSLISVFLITGALSAVAHADDDLLKGDYERDRYGIEFQQFKGGNSDSGTQGGMIGIRDSAYLMDWKKLHLGAAVYFGTPHGGDLSRDNLLYGGLIAGVDTTVSRIFELSLDALIGYGYGNSNISQIAGQSVAIQPTASAGFVLVRGWRASFSMGYLSMPSANGFSGQTFGIRLERKTESSPSYGLDH